MTRRFARSRNRFGRGQRAPTLSDDDFQSRTSPYAWLRADTFSDNGTKVTSFNDRVLGGHSVAQANDALRVAIPTPSTGFAGKQSAAFVRASSTRYVSSLAASEWRFLHDGTGCTVVNVFKSTNNTSTNGFMFATTDAGNGAGVRMCITTTGATGFVLTNGTTFIINSATGSFLTQPVYCGYSYSEGASPKYSRLQGAAVAASGSPTGAPSASDPATSLTIGTLTNGTGQFDGEWVETLVWKRVLTATDISNLSSYMRRYGL